MPTSWKMRIATPLQAGACRDAAACSPRAWEKRLHLTLSAASGLPRVAADPRKVRQVLAQASPTMR